MFAVTDEGAQDQGHRRYDAQPVQRHRERRSTTPDNVRPPLGIPLLFVFFIYFSFFTFCRPFSSILKREVLGIVLFQKIGIQ